MPDTKQSFIEKCYKDRDGNIVFFQSPNLPIIGWFIFMLSEKILNNNTYSQYASVLAFGCLFVWGWLELFSGATYLRRVLGLAILIVGTMNQVYS